MLVDNVMLASVIKKNLGKSEEDLLVEDVVATNFISNPCKPENKLFLPVHLQLLSS